MKIDFTNGDSTLYREIEVDANQAEIKLPEGLDLAQSTLVRDGMDLLINGQDGDAFLIPNYYRSETLADLQQSDGHIVSGDSLEQMSDVNAHAQYAQANIPGLEVAQGVVSADQGLGEPIGRVESVEGAVSVVRADGTTVTLDLGDAVYQGDRIETTSGGGVGITLADTSSFSLGENSEMVLDELVYDPGSQEGRSVFSLLEGTTSYVSGQIAKINPDAVSISTPVATIGIRGTKIYLEFEGGQFRAVNLLETTLNGETPGEIVIFAPDGTALGSTNEANQGWSWQGGSENIGTVVHFSPSMVEQLTRGVFRNLPPSLAEKAIEARELEQALKDAEQTAAREAEDAQAQAAEAEKQLATLEQKAAEAQEAVDALTEQALSEEEQLKLLQLQLEQLIKSGASEQEILQLQQAMSNLETSISVLWQNIEAAKQVALMAQEKALSAYQWMLDSREEAARANEVADLARNAMRDAHDIAQSAFKQAQSYLGYQANSPEGEQQQTTNSKTYIPEKPSDSDTTPPELIVTTFKGDDDDGSDNSLIGNSGGDTLGKEPDDPPTPSGDGNDNGTVEVSLAGKAVDGYLSGATVFIDRDKDGVLDANEASTTTDSKGGFSLTGSADTTGDYVISMIGGTDIATGKAFYGVLQAPAGSSVVTPLTTLLAYGVSEATLKTIFGLSDSIILTSTDPVASAGDTLGAKLAAVGVQIQNTILQAAYALEGASSNDLDNGATGSALFTALANQINSSGGTFDISQASDLEAVIKSAASSLLSGAELDKANGVAANTSQIIGVSNGVINTYIAQGGTGNDFLASLAQVAVVANDAAVALQDTISSNGNLSALVTQYDQSNIVGKIESASIGDVNGDGTTNTVNAAPTVSGTVSLSTNEDQAIIVTKETLLTSASDSDTDVLFVRNLSATNATVTQNNDGTWTITPTANSTAAITLSYDVSDGFKSVATTATVSVNSVNDLPVASNSSVSATEGAEVITGTLSATDVEDATLYYATSDQIAGFSLNSNGTYSFNPAHSSYDSLAKGQTQTITVNFRAYDSNEASGSGTLTITLTGTNDAPTVSSAVSFANTDLNPDTYQEDKAFTLTKAQLLANASDVDGDTLDVLNVSVQSGGSVVNNGDETWTVTPTANSTADVVLTYTVSDTKGGTVSQTATVDIDPVNDAPVVSNIVSLSGTEDIALNISTNQLLAYASDVDGDTLTVSSITPSAGSIVANDGGDGWIYTPVANSTDAVTFTYTISDGNGGTVQATAVANFTALNDAPTVSRTPVALSGTEDNSVIITQNQLLTDYASDVDGDSLSIQNLATTDGGTLTNNGDNTWTYVPTANVNGTINFTFKVSDGQTTTDGSATLTLAAVNDAPTVSATPSFNMIAGSDGFELTSALLLANASDVDGDTLSVTDITVSGGSLSTYGSGWWFSSQTAGAITISYNVYDGTAKTATTATVTVQEAQVNNLAPTIGDPISLSGEEDGGQTGYITITPAQLLAGAADNQDNVDDTISVVNLAISSGGGSLAYDSASGNWHYTPVLNSTSDVVFTYNVSDGVANSAQQTATLSLSAVNDAPVISNTVSLSGTEDTALNITAAQLLANASDVEGDTLSVQNLTASSGTLTATDSGWTFTPVANSTANVTFSYSVSDGNGGTVSTSAQATFSAVNDAPTVSGPVSLSGTEDATLTITKAQLLANASDVEGDNLSVQGLSVSNGTLTYQGNDTWTYAPVANFVGNVTFSYNVSDGKATTATTAVATFAEDGTTEGTSGIDTIVGTSGNDTITALAGADILTGGAGNDYLDGGEGDDTAIFSGNLADYTFSTNENGQTTVTDNNTADGDDGTDVLVSIEKYQFADQTTSGIPGEILGTDGADFISGGSGVDIVSSGNGNDWVFTYSGNDTINGGAGNDVILGGNGDDIINGDADSDWLWGGNGSDTITGGEGADYVYAGNSQDVIVLSNGDVTLDGGSSTDTLRLLNGDTLDFSSNSVTLVSIEVIDMLTDTSANHLGIGSSNVTAMNSSNNVVVNGNASDSVTFLDSGWVQGSTNNGYTTYDHAQSGAQASISETITVTLS